MKALSFHQPWGYLILHPELLQPPKSIENRSWLPSLFPMRICVHGAKHFDEQAFNWILDQKRQGNLSISGEAINYMVEQQVRWRRYGGTYDVLGSLAQRGMGAIIGEVTIIGYMTGSQSPWFVGPYGWQLANPVAYAQPIPYRGRQGFFNVQLEGNA